MIDLARTIKYPFSGDNFIAKALIGSLLAMLSPFFFITGFMLIGYQLRITRDVIEGRGEELPEFNDFGGDLVAGFKVFAGTLIYYLPALVLAGLGAWVAVSAITEFDLIDVMVYHQGPEYDRSKVGLVVVCFATALLWLLLSAPLVMAAVARYAETGEFSAFLDVLNLADEVWEQRNTAAALMFNLFLLGVLIQVASLVISSVVCFAGSYFNFAHMTMAAHLNGQWGAHLIKHRPRPNVIRPIDPPPWRQT